MQLENLRPQRNKENNDKKSDERYQINMINDKESDEIDQINENKEETLKMSLQKNIDYFEKWSDETYQMDISHNK